MIAKVIDFKLSLKWFKNKIHYYDPKNYLNNPQSNVTLPRFKNKN